MIGITAGAGYVRTALSQLGIPTVCVRSIREGLEQGVRVFVWNEEDELLRSTAERSSPEIAIITDHGFLASLLGEQSGSHSSAIHFQMPRGPFTERGFFIHLPARSLPHETYGYCAGEAGGIPGTGVCTHSVANKTFYSLPWDIARWQLGQDWGPRAYYSPRLSRHFVEIGCLVDSGALRRLLFDIVLKAFASLHVPLVRLSPFCKRGKCFAVRIDADGFSRESTDIVLGIADGLKLPFTWFIDVERWGKNIGVIRELSDRGQDVQLHCYKHMTYVSRLANRANIRAGWRTMKRHGIRARAVVSPLGYNHRGFADAIAGGPFLYSSEFGAAVDDLPFYPLNDPGRPLQVPTHPGSIGCLKGNGFSVEEVFQHLEWAITKCSDYDGIGILYDHPLDRIEKHPDDFRDLIGRLLKAGYTYINMSQYADLWRKRRLPEMVSISDGGRIHVELHPKTSEFCLELFGEEDLDRVGPCELPVVHGEAAPADDCFAPPSSSIIQELDERSRKNSLAQRTSVVEWYLKYFVSDFTKEAVLCPLRRMLRAVLRKRGRE
jgi:hypothetical protein